MRLRDLLDPDTNWRSFDKVQHFASGLILCALFDAFLPRSVAFLLVLWTAVVYEAGQTDAAYNIKDAGGHRYAGRPGFGFGFLDLAFGAGGALLYLGLRALL